MDTKKGIRICLLLPSLQPGGMERVMSELANNFANREQLEVHLVLYGSSREIFYSIPNNIVIHKPKWKFELSKRRLHALKTLLFIRRTVKSLKPDTILNFGEFWNNMVLLSLLGTGLPVYISERSKPNSDLGWVHNNLRKWLYPKAAGVILQTEKANTIYSKQFRKLNIKVIGNPIRKIICKGEIIKRQKNILMVGRFFFGKNQDRLIKIFARIGYPDWELVLVGHDLPGKNIMGDLKELAAKLGIEEKVKFTGEQQEVDQYYLASNIFAFTSNSEGFPNVIGEAMSAGLPVVSYDCPAGPSDMIVDNSSGFLIPLYDDVQFERKLKLLMNNEGMRNRFGQQAQVDISRFSVELIVQQFYEFITSHLKY